MSIRLISTEQLRRMEDQEGLVLQGCGGDPQEWLDGINEILAQECILKKGAGFQLQIISRSSLSGKGGFFRFRSKLPASEKRAPENMEVKSEKSNEFQTYENRPGIP